MLVLRLVWVVLGLRLAYGQSGNDFERQRDAAVAVAEAGDLHRAMVPLHLLSHHHRNHSNHHLVTTTTTTTSYVMNVQGMFEEQLGLGRTNAEMVDARNNIAVTAMRIGGDLGGGGGGGVGGSCWW